MINNIVNIEKVILSSIIFEPSIFETIAEKLKPKDFYLPFHRYLFETMIECEKEEKPIDEEFLKNKLHQKNLFDEETFLEILSSNPLSNTSAYIEEIKNSSKMRQIRELTLKIANDKDNNNPNTILSFLEEQIERLQKSDSRVERKTLFDVLNSNTEPNIVYSTGLEWLDKVLGGGFELGQLITITGEQEAGKTQLVNQILLNVAKGFKCQYFSLEFNERQLAFYIDKKIKNCNIDKNILKNISVITDEMTTGNIDDVVITIKQEYRKYQTKFVVIDSQMILFEDNENSKYATSEEKISSIFRKLHNLSKKLDICILLIAQSSKEDNKGNKVEIFGSKKAAHLARVMIHINFNRDKEAENHNGKRQIFIAKNKQNGKLAKIDVFFDRDKLEFETENDNNNNYFDDTITQEPEVWKNQIELFMEN